MKSWKSIIHPRQEVISGNITESSFAANLSQTVNGEGPAVYTDPKEFFERTYITDGLFSLLVKALQRLSGKGADAVVQIRTNFGGGKTHAMIALYHLLHSGEAAALAGCDKILQAAGMSKVPKTNIAVIVGIEHGALGYEDEWLGCRIHTLWGELAAQLSHEAGDKSIYGIMRQCDEEGAHPGTERLRTLFERAGGTVCIIIDELVKYAASLPVNEDKKAATDYASFMAFVQELTEAAASARRVLVVASLPSSELEADGPNGIAALDALSHHFGRLDTVWQSASAQEGFEIVRRRLFDECADSAARDEICKAFCDMYKEHRGDFPRPASEEEYLQRMKRCYPIHPEVFDVLYGTWSTLEKFQRTRGVLRFVASVIKILWSEEKSESIIMCGSLPLYDSNVHEALVRVLGNKTWESVIDKEIDGKESLPRRCDSNDLHFGECKPCVKIARTVMLGSAPSSVDSSLSMVRGVDAAHLMLGTVAPGQNISVFTDALRELSRQLTYLYSKQMERFWFDVHPTLRKTAAERADNYYNGDRVEIYDEIERRLRAMKHNNDAFAVCVCPSSPSVISDEKRARLVILRPSSPYSRTSRESSAAIAEARNILDKMGGERDRIYRNTLVFLACIDGDDTYTSLLHRAAEYLSWQSIKADVQSEAITIDNVQAKEMHSLSAAADKDAEEAVNAAYFALLAPSQPGGAALKWSEYDTKYNAAESIAQRAAKTARDNGLAASSAYNEAGFISDLDSLAEDGYASIGRLEEVYFSYCYMQRLSTPEVLHKVIKEAAEKGDIALASSYEDGKFTGLCMGAAAAQFAPFDKSTLAVQKQTAQKQLDEEKEQQEYAKEGGGNGAKSGGGNNDGINHGGSGAGGESQGEYGKERGGESKEETCPPPEKEAHTHFYLNRYLNANDPVGEFAKYIKHTAGILQGQKGVTLAVEITIDIWSDRGFLPKDESDVTENCKAFRLKQDEYGFDNESEQHG